MLKDIKLRFGQYKGQTLDSVPTDYLKWLVDRDILKGKAMVFAKTKLDYPKTTYNVTVTDSIGTDGNYTVEAYTQQHAINVCQAKYKIQNSQSGTEYFVTITSTVK